MYNCDCMSKIDTKRRTKKKRGKKERMRSPWIIFVERCMERDGVKRSDVVNSEDYRRDYYMEQA